MNCLIFFPEEVSSELIATVVGLRAKYVMHWHELVSDITIRCGIWGGNLGKGTVLEASTDRILVQIVLDREPPSRNGIAIIGIPRPQSLKKIIQNATVQGLKEVHFVNTSQVVPGYVSSKYFREENLKTELLKALEQACDTIPPKIILHKNWKAFTTNTLPQLIEGVDQLICADTKSVNSFKSPPTANFVIAIGPEAGWGEEERSIFTEKGFQFVSLGRRMLRVDQAVSTLTARLNLC